MKQLWALFLAALLGLTLVSCLPREASSSGGRRITAQEAKALMEQDAAVLLDVRTEEEYAAGHLQKALLLPLDELEARAGAVLPDKSVRVIVYCRSGRRSALAVQQLLNMGYEQVSDLGGILDWPYETVTD